MQDNYVIHIFVKNEEDIYNIFSNKTQFKDEFIQYITQKTKEDSSHKNIILRLESECAIDEDLFRNTLISFLKGRKNSVNQMLKRTFYNQTLMFFIGSCFIALSLLLQNSIPLLAYTILSTIGAFSIWEAAAIWIKERPRLRYIKKVLDKYHKTHLIEFVNK